MCKGWGTVFETGIGYFKGEELKPGAFQAVVQSRVQLVPPRREAVVEHDGANRHVAAQVDPFESKLLKPGNALIGTMVETGRAYKLWINWI
jgi:hypothetical protein